MISNLFDSNKPYALSTHNRKCITYGEALRIRIRKFEQNMRENYSKSTKIAITVCKFSKIFRGACPRTSIFLLVSQSASDLFCRKKKTLEKNVEIMPPLLKFLAPPLAIFSAMA